jgi:hypothetical protein
VDNIVFVHTSTHFVGVSFRTLGICRRSGPPFQIYLVSLPHGAIALNRKETTKQLRAGVSASGRIGL